MEVKMEKNMEHEIAAINQQSFKDKIKSYTKHPGSFLLLLLVLVAAALTVGVLVFLVGYILIRGIPYLKPSLFAWTYNSDNVSMLPAMINTLFMTVLALVLSVPFGVGAAIYLVEYAKKGNKLVGIIRVTAETLSGIPSIIYGLFGMLFFVTALKWGYSMMAGAATLAIMVLPVMRTTEEALLCVPDSFREGSFGLGAGKLRTIFKIVLPSAIPGILSGIILAIGRIVGETAALIYTSGTVANLAGFFDSGRTLAIHMYSLSREGMHTNEAYATAVVLLVVVLIINGVSSLIAKKFEAPKQ
jgi:phosphate transport system permease protein